MKKIIRFDTTAYEYVHGKKPRGRGQWCIALKGSVDVFVSPCATLSEAKKKFTKRLNNDHAFYTGSQHFVAEVLP